MRNADQNIDVVKILTDFPAYVSLYLSSYSSNHIYLFSGNRAYYLNTIKIPERNH